MTQIPSTQRTDDFVYSFEIRKDDSLFDPTAENLLVFDDFVPVAGSFHSLDIIALRDGNRTNDLEFLSFEHTRVAANIGHIKIKLCDGAARVREHHYILKLVLRYLREDNKLSSLPSFQQLSKS